jgi:hypothetical protein
MLKCCGFWEDLIKVNVYLMTQHHINTLVKVHALHFSLTQKNTDLDILNFTPCRLSFFTIDQTLD